MPFLELSLYARQVDHARYEAALEDIGALSVTLMDANADAPDEQAILEPGVGETPLWADLLVTALFPAGHQPELILAALEAFDAGLDLSSVRMREVPDQDWERVWMADYQPLAFGKRTFIVPWNRELPDTASGEEAAVVRLDPGLAFGSGTHPTTALCLEWLDNLDLAGKAVLDFGSGSGILALAALKLGAAEAVAVDNDPQALLATADNAERNAVADRLQVYLPADEPVRQYPVVVANILASALAALAEHLALRTEPGGVIALSGILHGQEPELLQIYTQWFDAITIARQEDWLRISGRRRDQQQPPSVPPCQGGSSSLLRDTEKGGDGQSQSAKCDGASSLPDKGGRGEGFLPYDKKLTALARQNRGNPTPAERMIWREILRKRQFARFKFLRQKPIGRYIVDFYYSELQLVMEIDGDSHAQSVEYDAKRTKFLNALGLQVIRYSNDDVLNNLEGVYDDLLRQLLLVEAKR